MTPKILSILRECLQLMSAYQAEEWVEVAKICKIHASKEDILRLRRDMKRAVADAESKLNRDRLSAKKKASKNQLRPKAATRFATSNDVSAFGRWLELIGRDQVSQMPGTERLGDKKSRIRKKV